MGMYICSTCQKGFKTKENLQKHFLNCWKEQHPYHKSKLAPQGENIETREITDDIMSFFNSFKE